MFYPIETLNILTEAIIAAQPFLMMQNVQMARSKRVKILCAFSSRLRYSFQRKSRLHT